MPTGGVVLGIIGEICELVRVRAGFDPEKKTLEATGEGLGFGMKFGDDYEAELRAFIQSESMKPGQHHFLEAAGKDGPFMVVTEMCVRQTKRV